MCTPYSNLYKRFLFLALLSFLISTFFYFVLNAVLFEPFLYTCIHIICIQTRQQKSHDKLGVGNVKALFGTAPNFWNTLLGVMAQLPSSLLANEPVMENLAIFSLPIVRVVDYFAGATNAMRCDLSCAKDKSLHGSALYAHENLEPGVGECVVAFCAAVLSKRVEAGVWFPEEAVDAGEDAAAVLNLASVGAHTVEVSGGMDLQVEEVWGSRN